MSLRKFVLPLCAALVCLPLAAGSASAAHLSLGITGVFDGPLTGGLPKVVELYAFEDVADLSQWAVGSANNGGGTDGPETILSGSASKGDFLYVVDGLAEFTSYFGPTTASVFDGSFGAGGAASINGDDAVEVFFDSTGAFAGSEVVGDTFGDINVDGSGEPWDYLDGWAYRNSLTSPTPPGGVFTIAEWSFSGINATDGDTSNATSNSPFPIGSFQPIPEPATFALMSIALCGLTTMRRR